MVTPAGSTPAVYSATPVDASSNSSASPQMQKFLQLLAQLEADLANAEKDPYTYAAKVLEDLGNLKAQETVVKGDGNADDATAMSDFDSQVVNSPAAPDLAKLFASGNVSDVINALNAINNDGQGPEISTLINNYASSHK